MGKWTSLGMLLILVVIAAGALFLDPDYPAHVPLRIGVCAFDSALAGETLLSFSTSVREQGGGDITWVWLGPGGKLSGCDFYLMTYPQMLQGADDEKSRSLLLSSPRKDGSLSMGVVIVRRDKEPDWSRTVFTSPFSSTGFISPLAAIFGSGQGSSEVEFETVSETCPVCGEAVVYGVLLGRYGAGGISLDELRRIEMRGEVDTGALKILYTGPELPEIVLVSDRSTEDWKSRGFARALPRITAELPDPLSREMARLGMAVFRRPAEGESNAYEKIPRDVWESAGYHFP
jgi:hypothetical protein